MNTIKISCIIPTHNRSEYLEQAISCVLGQTCLPFEIIVVNNGEEKVILSDEHSGNVVVYNTVPNQGASFARNFGASMASGEYIAFLDDDDLWAVDYLEKVVKEVSSGAKCIVGRLDSMSDGVIEKFKNFGTQVTIQDLFRYNPGATGSNVVIERNLFNAVKGYDVGLPAAEDKALIIEVLRSKNQVSYLEDNQAIMRIHEGERLTNPKNLLKGIEKFLDKYKEFMDCSSYLINKQKIYYYRSMAGNRLYMIPDYFIRLALHSFFK